MLTHAASHRPGRSRRGQFVLVLFSACVVGWALSLTIGRTPLDAAETALAETKTSAAGQAARLDYNRDIRPILSNNCFQCHGPDAKERQSGLRLDQRDAALQPAESGQRAIVPGQPAESRLVARIFSTDKTEIMPPPASNKQLTPQEKATLRTWISQGAEYQTHWSFQAPRRPALPAVKNTRWARNPIDHFILARLEAAGLQPAPEADRVTLIRRLSFDLTGLPPTLAEIDTFVNDNSPNAYEILVQRLMSSPHYGERLAVDWLDAARFADTNGYHIDNGRDMTRWREWVIAAFQQNLPFDQFTLDQLAGDLRPETPDAKVNLRRKIASGFHRNHMINFEGGAIPDEYHNAYIVDRVNTTATVWLGLTLACTQCHDHKYDPFSQREFYQLYAFFHNINEKGLDGYSGNAQPFLKAPTPSQQRELDSLAVSLQQLEQKLAGPSPEIDGAQSAWEKEALADPKALPAKVAAVLAVAPEKRSPTQQAELRHYYRSQVSPALRDVQQEVARLKQRQTELDKLIPTSMIMQELPRPRDTFLLIRGQYDRKGEKVTAAVPAALPPLPDGAPANRLGLAQWLVAPTHPLTARVTVNRYWQMFFGTGLVKTAEDFGSQGEPPSHPELLDWLALEFTQFDRPDSSSAWNLQALIKLIVTSSTYRQGSVLTPALSQKDPENRLLARGPRFRLQAEFIRDQALAVSGLLNREIGGRSVSPYQPAGLWEELMARADGKNWTAQTYTQSHGPDLYRRTMYTFWKRTCPPPTLTTFDAPDRETCTVRRARTNTPLQALILLNDPTYVEASRKLAERVLLEGGPNFDTRVTFLVRTILARNPKPQELAVLKRLYDQQLHKYRQNDTAAQKLLKVGEAPFDDKLPPAEIAAWSTISSVILNLDEAVTKN